MKFKFFLSGSLEIYQSMKCSYSFIYCILFTYLIYYLKG